MFWANAVLLAPVEPNIVTNSPGYIVASLSSTPNNLAKSITRPEKSVSNRDASSICNSSLLLTSTR